MIARDSLTAVASTTNSSFTYSHTCSGSLRVLCVVTSSVTSVTGVTYNSVAMTEVPAASFTDDGSRVWKFWYLVAPATGANNVVVTLSASDTVYSGAISYTGVKQTSTIDDSGNMSTVTSFYPTLTLTSTVFGTVFVGMLRSPSGAPTTRNIAAVSGGSIDILESVSDLQNTGDEDLTIQTPGADSYMGGVLLTPDTSPSANVYKIALDDFEENVASGTGSGVDTFSFTNTTGSLLMVAVMIDTNTDSVSSVSYNGVSLTELYQDITDIIRLYVGYLINPSTGTHDVVITFTPGTPLVYRAGAVSFSNVDTTDPFGGSTSEKNMNSDTPTHKDVTVTTESTSGVVIDFFGGSRVDTGNSTPAQINIMKNTGTWSSGVNKFAGISYYRHTGENPVMVWKDLTYTTAASDQIHFAVELLESRFIPQAMFY